jgi:hypothetical protein
MKRIFTLIAILTLSASSFAAVHSTPVLKSDAIPVVKSTVGFQTNTELNNNVQYKITTESELNKVSLRKRKDTKWYV